MHPARFVIPIALAVLIVVALSRVAATWDVYSVTYDEPYHLAGGMEWLDRGEFTYGPMHPPLARVAGAFGLYMNGYHTRGERDVYAEGTAVLNQRSEPRRAITLARAGILPFLLLSILVVFAWTRSLAGDAVGLLAVIAFTSVPPVLAHSGLATTDAAAMATISAALFALVRWLEEPGGARTCWLGVAVGFAFLAKMSALIFIPAVGIVLLFGWQVEGNRVKPHVGKAVLAGAIALFVVWAGYRFSVGPIFTGSGGLGPTANRGVPVPAPELPRGFLQMLQENFKGRRAYVLGSVTMSGRWYFFPLALSVKTPIPFLLLAGVGGAALIAQARRRWLAAASVVSAGTMLLTALPANLNIGVRHVLPMFPMLAVCAGLGLRRLWDWRRLRLTGPLLAIGLGGWLVTESAFAHPDYLPYFNQLAGDRPEEVLVAGDLDWGQDLNRLVVTLHARDIEHVCIIYHGKADLSKQGLPSFTVLQPNTRVTGWVAASIYSLKLGLPGTRLDAFAWLRDYRPVARVGRSILLYFIEPHGVKVPQ
jgi:hypothetical protein